MAVMRRTADLHRLPAGASLCSAAHTRYDGRVSPDYRIRTATPADIDALDAIERECFPPAEAATREALAARLQQYPDHFWLLEVPVDPHHAASHHTAPSPTTPHDMRIVSFVNGMTTDEPHLLDAMYDDATMHDPSGSWQMIFGVDTLPAFRRHGYAGTLLKRVIDDARKDGRSGVVLTCKDRLVHYYASFGFIDEGISESTHGDVIWHEMRVRFQ